VPYITPLTAGDHSFALVRFITYLHKTGVMKQYIIGCLLLLSATGWAQEWMKEYDFVDDCICGLAKVSKGNKSGFVNKKGVLIVPLTYDEVLTFQEGMAAVRINNKWGYLDSTGAVVTEPQFEDAGSFYDSLAAVKKQGKYGYINHQMRLVIPCTFELARGFAEGLAPVANSKNLWGYINKQGELILPYQYHFADLFNGGKARVMKDEKMMLIDRNGKEVKEE
jgi:hypothetical protein